MRSPSNNALSRRRAVLLQPGVALPGGGDHPPAGGREPALSPSRRDAIILGHTVFELLDRYRGPEACALLVSRLRRDGSASNIELVFDAPINEIEEAWRTQLDDIVYGRAAELPPASAEDSSAGRSVTS
jgi:hypothetical protein